MKLQHVSKQEAMKGAVNPSRLKPVRGDSSLKVQRISNQEAMKHAVNPSEARLKLVTVRGDLKKNTSESADEDEGSLSHDCSDCDDVTVYSSKPLCSSHSAAVSSFASS